MLPVAFYTDGKHPDQKTAYKFFGRNRCVYSAIQYELPSHRFFDQLIFGIALKEGIFFLRLGQIEFYDLQTWKGYLFFHPGTFQYDRVLLSLNHRARTLHLGGLEMKECPDDVYQAFRMLIGELAPLRMTGEEITNEDFARWDLKQRGYRILTPDEARKQGHVFINATHVYSLNGLLALFSDSPLRRFACKQYGRENLSGLAIVDNRQYPRLMGQAAGFEPGKIERCQYSLWPKQELAAEIDRRNTCE